METCNKYNDWIWLSYASGRLASSAVAEMESHCETCTECASRRDFARKIAAMMDLNAGEPPESWTDEAARIFKTLEQGQESSSVFGNLVFDSYVHGREAVRSRSLETRHLLFDLPDFELDLVLEHSGRQINMVMGHLLSKREQPGAVHPDFTVELQVADRSYSAQPNPFGEFLFTLQAPLTGEPLELRCAFKEGPCAVVLIPC